MKKVKIIPSGHSELTEAKMSNTIACARQRYRLCVAEPELHYKLKSFDFLNVGV